MNFQLSNPFIFHSITTIQFLRNADFLEKKLSFYFFTQKVVISEKNHECFYASASVRPVLALGPSIIRDLSQLEGQKKAFTRFFF